ncbi:MAG: ChaN family lipoprotein [Planctomycetes bacterium]|nr:ChaN family lipoprotein [Planctomycetota bacterium]
MNPIGLFAALSLLAVSSTACRSLSTPVPPEPPSAERLQGLNLFDGNTGAAATWQELEARVDQADAVICGELHGHPLGLPYAALLYQGSLDRNPNTALALEFICRDRQFALDAYAADLIDFEGLQSALEGSKGNTVKDHGPMIQASHEAGRPVYAANAPRIYTTAARLKGYDALNALNAEQQRLFDVPDPMPNAEYKQRFFEFMGASGHGEEGAEEDAEANEMMLSVFRAQALWDGTMSATTARAMDDGNRPVFLVVGHFHCDTNGGTLELLKRHKPDANVLVLSVTDDWSDVLREEDKGRADYIVYVGPYPDED